MNRTRYTVTASVTWTTKPNGWVSARQVPTFTLPDAGNSLATTAKTARSVIDPFGLLTVNLNIWDDAESASYSKTFTPEG